MKSTRVWLLSLVLGVAATLATPGAQARPGGLSDPGGAAQDPAAGQARAFTGTPIDVDYQGANLRTVLRQLSDIGGVNLVIDPSVPLNAPVDLKLTQVPWDQVLDVILKTTQLTYQVDGPVVRVMTREARTKELEDEARQKKASQAAPDLATARVRLNYATAPAVKKLLEQGRVITERGTVDVDERTNMLILKDTTQNLDEIKKLLADLDKPEPQVEIEAKIVQTNHDTARQLGVQWGFNGRVSPELGNTTDLAFPNSGSISGRTTQQGSVTQGPNDPRASDQSRTGTAVNLPATGATSAVGISLGAINGAFNLDVALSALEHKGQLKILSTPKVTTQNNQEAQVTQGFQIPIQIVANNTVTVQFKDAALKLVVTPQITAANTVIMKIALENGQPDFSRAVNGNPSINTQTATTQVQVADGITTVIGGIVQSQETNAKDSVPGISKLPLLGWLFRHDSNESQSQELLIFITPRILH
ncbi:MAG TPA: type IV pilus secretin PilQ [Vicinamibacterales bacterium]|nr:type IV pilus secretin PilQ [Vicinamibacterales bacterium]